MTVIVHISDLHIGDSEFNEEVFIRAVSEINYLQPDMIILTGDITSNGYYAEYKQATKYLEMFEATASPARRWRSAACGCAGA